MKYFNRLVIVLLLLLVMPLAASAISISYSNSGTLEGVYSGNDTPSVLSSYGWGSLVEYAKVDLPDITSGGLTLFSDDGWYSGTWSTLLNVEYYTVKTTDNFALYSLETPTNFGTWSTIDIDTGTHELSHLSTFDAAPAPVPEPSTLLLLGAGIAGLVVYRRKNN